MTKYSLIIICLLALIWGVEANEISSEQRVSSSEGKTVTSSENRVAREIKNPIYSLLSTHYYSSMVSDFQEWTAIAAPATSADRLTHATVYDPVGDKIYMIGGCPAGGAGTQLALCQQYDPVANTWADKAPMPTARGWIAGSYVRGKIYVIGGLTNAGAATNVNEEYTISSNTWATKTPSPDARLATLEGVWRDSLVYVMGGWDGVSSAGMTRVDIYDPFTNTWALGTPLPLAGEMGSCAIVGDTIYITNAVNRSGSACWTSIYKGGINPANPTTITWAPGPVPPSLTSITATAAIGNDIYWMGGFINLTTGSNTCWKLNRTTGVISTVDAYPFTIARNNFLVSRPSAYELYAIAGDANCNWSAPNNYYYKITFPPPMPNDVGVDAILSPGNYHTPNTVMTPSASVKNYGTLPQPNFQVVCSIVGPAGAFRYTNTQTVTSLAAGATTTVNFTPWTPTIQEAVTVMMKTTLTGDENPANDRKTRVTNIANVYSQDFESSNGNFVPDPLTGGWEWGTATYGPPSAHSGTKLWGTLLDYQYPIGANFKLTSLQYTATANNPTLRFWHWYEMETYWDGGNVKISTDSGATWTVVTPVGGYNGTASTLTAGIPGEPCYTGTTTGNSWNEATFNLTLTSGQTFYLRWHFGSDNSGNYAGWYIDDVLGEGFGPQPPPSRDVGIEAIRAPLGTLTINIPMTPIALVKNYGSQVQSFPVVCSIVGSGTLRYTSTQPVTNLAPGDTQRVSFTPPYTPTVAEIETVKMRTNLTNDTNPANDRMIRATLIIADLLFEGFNDVTFPPAGWQSVILNGTYNWTRVTSGSSPSCLPYDGIAMASYPSFNAQQGQGARLITPPINAGTVNPCTLKFAMYHDPEYPAPPGGPDSVRIQTSTNGTTFNYVTAFRRYEAVAGWTVHTVYLGTFTGNLYVGFEAYSEYGNNMFIDMVRIKGITGIEEVNPNKLPTITTLNAPKPNPVTNGIAKISFTISEPTKASLKIYDASGRLIKTLVNTNLDSGVYNYTWNGTDEHNNAVAEGIYFYTLQTDKQNFTKKLVMMR